ncbi:phosphate/phosphite/phosphonate ABC transporter substrate-binding protein [Achromobacter deleyi]|uniref:phosphate/phosphite/phosphonate ABC transporter substrate-binding protein n=1 Tax=Achromobacter deleyi TaxID=1353891 RepID=UPI0014920529|nr:PhnD/SsuA/transferrin family substrate-binding protein [Achromobacter deleyi]QVQ28890.1 PhnD/SsuA/transferrin family substrate-binding protein [Achromobacter deleyi]UIP19004.1 PhnD/SsuA/transferrin family substrate-binding protein [Achromobacter deleyi]
MTLITSTRMYDVAPAASAAWHALLRAAHVRAGLDIQFVEHGWPTPIGELWERPGLCGVFMCGWPFVRAVRAGRRYTPMASVVPSWPEYAGLPRYRSEFLVRADSEWATLADAAGSRYGWMVRDSQSGWNAPRAALAALAPAGGLSQPGFFAESKGPYGNPRGLLRALAGREIDLTAVDGWYLDLLRAHDPDALAGLRTLACTPWTPNPLLVAGPDVDAGVTEKLSNVLLAMHLDDRYKDLLQQAHVARFVPPDAARYDVLIDMERQAAERGYEEIA